MNNSEPLDEAIRAIERLPISDEDKAFLISVRKQFEAESSAGIADPNGQDGHGHV